MEIIKFIKWWWKNLNAGEKVIILFVLWISVAIANIFLFSFHVAALVFYAGLGISALSVVINLIYTSIRLQWRKYNYEREKEAQDLVNRLKGHNR